MIDVPRKRCCRKSFSFGGGTARAVRVVGWSAGTGIWPRTSVVWQIAGQKCVLYRAESLEIRGDPVSASGQGQSEALILYAPPPENVTGGLLRSILDVLLPSPCLACGEAVREPRRSLGLCAPCRGRLVRWPQDACDGCGRPLGGADRPAGYRCGTCRRRPPPYERLLSVWKYQPPLDAVLTGLKFRRLEYLGAQLGRATADLLRGEIGDCELVVPVPLHWWRYLRRGYNQASAIARPIASELGLPMSGALSRRRATPAQSRLSRVERHGNLRGAFSTRAGGAARCKGRRVLLVDDVVTTGTTLQTAAACLCRAGAASVIAVTVARTPEPDLAKKPH